MNRRIAYQFAYQADKFLIITEDFNNKQTICVSFYTNGKEPAASHNYYGFYSTELMANGTFNT
jgi:hypothetical protein